MNSAICSHCRLSLRRTIRAALRTSRHQTAAQSTVPASLTRPSRTPPSDSPAATTSPDLASLLSQPTWSVRSLLASEASSTAPEPPTITSKTLHHLLRLTALPLPQTPDEEAQMLAMLCSQLHFVRAIQGVDTTGVAPLCVIRDETTRGLPAQTIGLAELREALEMEDVVGHARRPRRRRTQKLSPALEQQSSSSGKEEGVEEQGQISKEEDWDVLGEASETTKGRYFVVRSGGTMSLPDNTLG
ncbi:hypothetical protein F5Y10DRAFT_263229 [Nemania abortiva]|nr:hypothetical protein F5Y10DRAFT_263229 [Nemania abortiva]